MAKSLQIVYARESPPQEITKSIFLAGPTPRSADVRSWRPQALALLELYHYDGVVFVPEPRTGVWPDGNKELLKKEQIEWEEHYLNMADCILFWIPRNMTNMPALTTNVEWGMWYDSGKIVFGAPDHAEHVGYLQHYAAKFNIPSATSLYDLVKIACDRLGDGALRSDGERCVPLFVWQTKHFQQWYQAQRASNHRLESARLAWTFRVGPQKEVVFFWVLAVDLAIPGEQRLKQNEVVISRPDIATILLYRRAYSLEQTDIVLVREVRSPAATPDGYVWEIPGGSSLDSEKEIAQIAIEECFEETGLLFPPQRLRFHQTRQMASTMSSHRAHLFSVELTDSELSKLRDQFGVRHGIACEDEHTFVEICKVGDILQRQNTDWAMLGMILSVLSL